MMRNALASDTRRPPAVVVGGTPSTHEAISSSDDIVTALNGCLAHLIDLKMRAKRAHWNAKGGSFYALHKMLDEFSLDLEALSDEVGERVIAVGGTAAGSAIEVARRSTLPKEVPRSTRADDVPP